jgi:hypothetical protein
MHTSYIHFVQYICHLGMNKLFTVYTVTGTKIFGYILIVLIRYVHIRETDVLDVQ